MAKSRARREAERKLVYSQTLTNKSTRAQQVADRHFAATRGPGDVARRPEGVTYETKTVPRSSGTDLHTYQVPISEAMRSYQRSYPKKRRRDVFGSY